MIHSRLWLLALVLLTVAFVSSACTGGGDDGDGVTVFAAASLADAFTEIGDAFHAANPDASVAFNFAGSQDLRTQLEQGAHADVFASADLQQMEAAEASGLVVRESAVFTHNRLVVIVPRANEAGITTLQDLAKDGVKLVVANADVPVGNYAREFLDRASADPAFGATYKDDVLANLVSEESNVKQVAAKLQLDESDAGIVYSSDVTPELAEDVTKIDIPNAFNQIATYPIALTSDASNAEVAQAFIDFVLSDAGQAILESHGFITVDA